MAQTTIQGSFLGDGTVTGAKIAADLISAQTALASGLSTTDELIVSDAGVIKRMDISVIEIAASQITASGTLPALVGTALTALDASNLSTGTLPAARIGADSIVEGKLNVSNGPSNGYILTARDGVAGGFTWEAASAGGASIGNSPTVNELVTVASTTSNLDAEPELTFSASILGFLTSGSTDAKMTIGIAAGASAAPRLHFNEGSGDGSANNAGYSFVYSQGNANFRLEAAGSGYVFTVADGTAAMNLPNQPAFLALNSSNMNNVTGNGGTPVIQCDTEVFDQNGDYNNSTYTFQAPVTGRYFLSATVGLEQFDTSSTLAFIYVTTSNRNYRVDYHGLPDSVNTSFHVCSDQLVDMDVGDTAQLKVQVTGMSNDTIEVQGYSSPETHFCGYLVA